MIICVDMDAFFASVEKSSKPNLIDEPVAIIGAKERTVVTTACYIARKYGVKTGMSKYEALKMCPFINIIPGNNRKYTYVSSRIMDFLKGISPGVEVYSVDEAFLEVEDFEEAEENVKKIKNYVSSEFGITCSVGGGKSMLVAKMASGVKKPDGLMLVPDDEILAFMDMFKLDDIWGIGKRTAKKFYDIGVFNTCDVRKLGLNRLISMFGKNGDYYYKMAHGSYYRGIESECSPVKSVGHSMTLPVDVNDEEMFNAYLLQLCEMVSSRARKNCVSGKTVSLTVRFPDMTSVTKRHTINHITCATHHIYDISLYITGLLNIDLQSTGVRLIGVSLSGLVHGSLELGSVFDKSCMPDVYRVIDVINEKYGDFSISFASVLKCSRKGARTISPAWKPDGLRNVNVF